MLKRDIQGKFALKNDDYRLVRSLRLTDEAWKALGIVAECNGLTRADYLEQIVRDNTLPSITRDESENHPCITPKDEHFSIMPSMAQLTALRDRILSELKLGK